MAEGAHWFYDLEGARKMRDALDEFKGGKIVVNVNVPHKCPVAPLEITFMLRDFLAGKGVLDKSEITYTYPIGRLHALEPVAHWTVPEFQRDGIKSETFFNTKSVDPKAKTITSEEGMTLPYDLLDHHPAAHRPAGDPRFQSRRRRLGADREAIRCCARVPTTSSSSATPPTSRSPRRARPRISRPTRSSTISSSLIKEDRWARDYDGKVFCFVETGFSTGTYVWFNYTTPPNPGPPSQMIHWFKLGL